MVCGRWELPRSPGRPLGQELRLAGAAVPHAEARRGASARATRPTSQVAAQSWARTPLVNEGPQHSRGASRWGRAHLDFEPQGLVPLCLGRGGVARESARVAYNLQARLPPTGRDEDSGRWCTNRLLGPPRHRAGAPGRALVLPPRSVTPREGAKLHQPPWADTYSPLITLPHTHAFGHDGLLHLAISRGQRPS